MRPLPLAAAGELPAPYDGLLHAYAGALAHSRLAPSSRAVYLRRVRAYLAWIAAAVADGRLAEEPLADMTAAVRTACAYHRTLAARDSPRILTGVLAAVEDFHTRLRLGGTGIPRGATPPPLVTPVRGT
ncbi:hypothetical protein [Nonomuraea gerenzanensis]|uniref:Integrase n=1 Tax=Nonomuraea gerenzanensis TaxID=93944 RepID=A0A1M4ELS0_9ACTN|nr:hypothetical protein [Nonomuraea gerenzanensis]UBU11310.1 hypothetical protein LCN96_44500 [Nonomuraea gerenzanensis]SBO99786.1 hypothetical protein BN4615_P9302 [Nonomuraea gerenzanensis]